VFEAFVAARSDELLRTAVLPTCDRGHDEDLLQTALVKDHRRWSRIDGDEPHHDHLGAGVTTDPASVVAVRQPAAEARAPWSAALRAPVQEGRHHREHDTEEQLGDPHNGLVAGEPGHRRHQQDDGDAGREDGDEPLATVPRA
jgi:hypothetical protein